MLTARNWDLDRTADDAHGRALAAAAAALDAARLTGDVLEIACGTGWWTRRLVRFARNVTALDAAPEMLDLHRRRVPAPNVRRIEADVFAWQPDRAYDGVFFAFWLSHVPPDRFGEFWGKVDDALASEGRVFFVDETEWGCPRGHEVELGDERGTTLRWVEDGRGFRIVKRYHRPAELEAALADLGWAVDVRLPGERIYHALGRRAQFRGQARNCSAIPPSRPGARST